jgi:hypothetical protein
MAAAVGDLANRIDRVGIGLRSRPGHAEAGAVHDAAVDADGDRQARDAVRFGEAGQE